MSDHNSPNEINPAAVEQKLRELFARYTTENLKNITSADFSSYIHSRLGAVDFETEGYARGEVDRQRDLSVKFYWGHNHDFGEFALEGRMGDRHIDLLSNFVSYFPVSLGDFRNKNVFDIGCWTGGTTLLLSALSSKVLAIEEVKKYAEMVGFLCESFGIDDHVKIEPRSIYSCNSQEFHNRFDIAYFPGVIYHLTDPLIALRILFNSLRFKGIILIESLGIDSEEPLCRFDGSRVCHSGDKANLNRTGWNWFTPSPSALACMMQEAGFDEVQSVWHYETGRIYAYGKKTEHVGICRAGLSVPDIS